MYKGAVNLEVVSVPGDLMSWKDMDFRMVILAVNSCDG